MIYNFKKSGLFLLALVILKSSAQEISTLYWMKNNPVRHYLNPAFKPEYDFYVSLPVIGFSQFEVGTNSLTAKDVLYKSNNQIIPFYRSNVGITNFYKGLSNTEEAKFNAQINLLGFGFKSHENYWTFGVSAKVDVAGSIPKDLLRLSIYGMPDLNYNRFDLKKLQLAASAYTEFAIGLSRHINDKLTLGAKIKYLMGNMNVLVSNNQLDLYLDINQWRLQGSGSLNISSPAKIKISNDLKSVDYQLPSTIAHWFQSCGGGAGIDIGGEYSFSDNIKISASLTDLGFILWKKNAANVNYSVDYLYDGVLKWSNNSVDDLKDLYENLTVRQFVDPIKNSATPSYKKYVTSTATKLNIGGEYSFTPKFGIALLSHTMYFNKLLNEEVSITGTARFGRIFNANIGTSLINGNLSSIGLGMGVKAGFIHLFIASDYIPLIKITVPAETFDNNKQFVLPYNTSKLNIATGINIVFDKPERHSRIYRKKQDCHCVW